MVFLHEQTILQGSKGYIISKQNTSLRPKSVCVFYLDVLLLGDIEIDYVGTQFMLNIVR